MSKYVAKITNSTDSGFFALIVRVDYDGQENVIHGYASRHFATRKAAEKSTSRYLKKIGA